MQLNHDQRASSSHFIGAVALLTICVALLAWLGQNRALAVASAVLGIYALHLVSLRYILRGQAENKARLETQWKLLQLLVDPNALEAGTEVRGDPVPIAAERARRLHGNGAVAESAEYRIPTSRHFALGTVALIRNMLSPAQVARILVEQRQQPDKKFATLAVDLGMLNEAQREELLLAQQEGLFSDAEMREARERLREFRKSTAKALAEHE